MTHYPYSFLWPYPESCARAIVKLISCLHVFLSRPFLAVVWNHILYTVAPFSIHAPLFVVSFSFCPLHCHFADTTIYYALVNQVSLGAPVWTTTLMCDVSVLKMARHLWPITRGCIIPIVTTATVQNNPASFTNRCRYTFIVCGPCFVLAGELKNHKSSMLGENSQSEQVHSHHKFCDSCGVDFKLKHHNDAGKDK